MIRVLNIISDTNIGGAGRVLINYLQYAAPGESAEGPSGGAEHHGL